MHPPVLQRIAYAKEESDIIAKAKGQYVAKDRDERKKRNKEARGTVFCLLQQDWRDLKTSTACSVYALYCGNVKGLLHGMQNN